MEGEKIDKREIHAFLECVNDDLNEFIKTRIQEGIGGNKDWSKLFQAPNPKWCWETLGCENKTCPVRSQSDYRCWLIAGTLCGGKTQGVFAQKFGNCVKCVVYQQYHVTPIRSLYENISTLVAHMSDEAHEFHRKATTDSLTGLLNRASFDDIVEREVKRSKRLDGVSLTLVVFDLDHFKEINDESGHLVGDYYLMEFAKLLRNVSRETDFTFRTGGDEFVVLMIGATEKEMSVYIHRVQEAIFRWNDAEDHLYSYQLAASAGGACLNDLGYDVEVCLNKADQRMYQNKQERRAPALTS